MAEPNTNTEVVIPPQTQEEQNQDMMDILADPEIQDLYQQAFPETKDNATVSAQQPVLPQDPDEVDQLGFWDKMAKGLEANAETESIGQEAFGGAVSREIGRAHV